MKTLSMLIGLLALAVLTVIPAAAATYEVTGVSSDDVLNIRLAPRSSAPKVGSYGPRDSGIKIFERRGNWALTGRANRNVPDGWVNARFLKLTAAAGRFRLPLKCVGTEPFWSLTIQTPRRAVYDDPETPGRSYRVRNFESSGPDASMWLEPGGRVVIAADRCSDGMSDNIFPYTTQVRLPGGRQLQGCCR
jgi:uncharacterized membrane protein